MFKYVTRGQGFSIGAVDVPPPMLDSIRDTDLASISKSQFLISDPEHVGKWIAAIESASDATLDDARSQLSFLSKQLVSAIDDCRLNLWSGDHGIIDLSPIDAVATMLEKGFIDARDSLAATLRAPKNRNHAPYLRGALQFLAEGIAFLEASGGAVPELTESLDDIAATYEALIADVVAVRDGLGSNYSATAAVLNDVECIRADEAKAFGDKGCAPAQRSTRHDIERFGWIAGERMALWSYACASEERRKEMRDDGSYRPLLAWEAKQLRDLSVAALKHFEDVYLRDGFVATLRQVAASHHFTGDSRSGWSRTDYSYDTRQRILRMHYGLMSDKAKKELEEELASLPAKRKQDADDSLFHRDRASAWDDFLSTLDRAIRPDAGAERSLHLKKVDDRWIANDVVTGNALVVYPTPGSGGYPDAIMAVRFDAHAIVDGIPATDDFMRAMTGGEFGDGSRPAMTCSYCSLADFLERNADAMDQGYFFPEGAVRISAETTSKESPFFARKSKDVEDAAPTVAY